jgi:hypothetical protein
MDLLGDLCEEAGNQEATCREDMRGAEGRDAQALLLARLPSSLKHSKAARGAATAKPELLRTICDLQGRRFLLVTPGWLLRPRSASTLVLRWSIMPGLI